MKTNNLITDHMDIWTAAQTLKGNGGKGRGNNGNGQSSHGIKKLRELILELAVRGKLVPQDPSDEPASVLMEKIAKEKKRLIKEGKIKKEKPFSEIQEEEKRFELPVGWEWARLGTISQINPRNEAEDLLRVSFIPMPLISTSHTGEHGHEIKMWGEIKKAYTHFADGDIGVAKITPCFENSKAVVFTGLSNGIGAGTTELHIARPFGLTLVPRYILLFLKTPIFLQTGEAKMTGTAGQKRLPKDFFSEFPLPLPPINEQHRIVAKVDELMALCDQLEQQQSGSNDIHQALVETLLATLTKAADPKEFAQAWRRIADHFDTLFTTEPSIDQLKQTLLQLAVMGRLVPQDPNDEPAGVLLEKIAKEKKRLIKEGKFHKQRPFPEIREYEEPFSLPIGWEWIRFGDIGEIIGGGTPNKSISAFWNGDIPWISPKDMKVDYISNSIDKITPEAVEKTSAKMIPANSLLVVVRGMILSHSFPTAINSVPVTINQDMKAIVLNGYEKSFMLLMVKGLKNDFVEMVEHSTHGTCKIVSDKLLNRILAIPPIAEQRRIVAKVDELMALCDELKARLSAAQSTQIQLADAIVEQAVA